MSLFFSTSIPLLTVHVRSDDAEGRQLRVPDNLLLVAAVGFLAGLLGYATEGIRLLSSSIFVSVFKEQVPKLRCVLSEETAPEISGLLVSLK